MQKVWISVVAIVLFCGCASSVKVKTLPLYQTPVEIKGLHNEQSQYALTFVRFEF